MKLFSKIKKQSTALTPTPQVPPVLFAGDTRQSSHPFAMLDGYTPLASPEFRLYEAIREGIPVVDAAILKTVRLVGGFAVSCENESIQKKLDDFLKQVNVGGVSMGVESFIASYLDSLITYGNALGEMIIDQNTGQFIGLYNADITPIQVRAKKNQMEVDFFCESAPGVLQKLPYSDQILFTALSAKPGEHTGISVLRSLPFVSGILLEIFSSVQQNFKRVGNIRYAVTYKPSGDALDQSYAKERAELIAKEWSAGMRATASGQIKDFISVGDVNIKVIGADNQVLDTSVPARHMLEQIVAKLGIPPFLLGLSWSSTERMSQQQTDILTTELEFYRRLLTPVILKICNTYLRLEGLESALDITWESISLKDAVEEARARLYLAQAKTIEQQLTSNS